MAYTQLIKTLQRNLQQLYGQYSRQKCFYLHKRNVSTVSKFTFCRYMDVVSPCSPVSSPPVKRPACHSFSLYLTARNKSSPEDKDKSVSRYQSGTLKTSTAQKVKDAGRDFTYLIVVLIGLGVTGGLLYVVFQELFSYSSPNKIYGKAFKKVQLDPEVIGAFGEPIKCYGTTTRRGRRQHVRHMEYMKHGLKHMQLEFYIEGSEPGLKGTVHVDSKENPETGQYEFNFIIVDIDTYPRRTIIVEDNRHER
ncbi:mitochondrial import inner membrane translocase subunit Tim21-like [Takifugu flavidus]|uniref:Mitochondrial import inner membrane translocase subunit Tim21 n=1 Tax=Takifugu flavidus TaxID=433684 RepID=A0A5C6NZ69_9TELE|nr:mitochondrial import inner membrane translocase subunit Tim21-like [Takifugu flavidus]XP_056869793.1 mitochondrial import inner membrane translocase subunit Tim21-like [Takifugu flavidus]XP_056869794.1 mitochondrial import inner membrane translocase subunit Tim21-like [Takifugu flavidus]XP_056869795.1 mitochondrial import inner membrane translocase subunit Tim21-like [Takifugu flavidus]XP_056869796.1 mitochondrial import inner membrane translocase subunit Tim21-like [Takifugu flavidus]XP_05